MDDLVSVIKEFYNPTDTDTMIPYHFNYLLSLITGIFDNLAIAAKNKQEIGIMNSVNPVTKPLHFTRNG